MHPHGGKSRRNYLVHITHFRRKKIFERRRKISRKTEISNFKNRKNSKIRVSSCVCARERRNLCIFPDVDAIKYQKIRFEPLFKPVERISTLYPNSYPSREFWAIVGLKNCFSCFCTLKYPNKNDLTVLFWYFCTY